MRKLLALVCIAMLMANCDLKAQTERGTLMLGGSASLQATEDASVFLFNPNFGVLAANNFAVGLQASILSSEGYSQWALGPFARLYFGKNDKGKLFGQGSVSINGGDGSDVFLGAGLTGGYAVFLNQSIAVELSVSYFRIDDSGLVIAGAGFQIHFKKQK
ncbi:MAG: hypothetical protein JNN00_18690 [Chitinophagaceae bacterium]|nr:hypothetical protein [Chitinophagaceae bacterium]